MIRATFKGLLGRKLRTALTAFAIVLGVAMVTGAYVADRHDRSAFGELSTPGLQCRRRITAKRASRATTNGGRRRRRCRRRSCQRCSTCRRWPAPGRDDRHREAHGKSGKVITRGGRPGLAFSYSPPTRPSARSPASGSCPTARRDRHRRRHRSKQHYMVGDTIGVIARGPSASTGSAARSLSRGRLDRRRHDHGLPADGAQTLFRRAGPSTQSSCRRARAPHRRRSWPRSRPCSRRSAHVRPARRRPAATKGMSVPRHLQDLRSPFGGIALFVGSFIIFNTLSITVAQRAREFGLMRMIGASRRQILRSVLLEASLIGLLASVIGIVVGFRLAQGPQPLFSPFGLDLPPTGTVFETRTLLVALLVGIVGSRCLPGSSGAARHPDPAGRGSARGVSSLPPSRIARFAAARRARDPARRVPALLRHLRRGHHDRQRLGTMGAGACSCSWAWRCSRRGSYRRSRRCSAGPRRASSAPRAARPRERHAQPGPDRHDRGRAHDRLRPGHVRGVLAHGFKTSFSTRLDQLFWPNFAVTATTTSAPPPFAWRTPPRSAARREGGHHVRAGQVKAFGTTLDLTGIQPDISRVINFKWQPGCPATPAALGGDGAIIKEVRLRPQAPGRFAASPSRRRTRKFITSSVRGVTSPPEFGIPRRRQISKPAL